MTPVSFFLKLPGSLYGFCYYATSLPNILQYLYEECFLDYASTNNIASRLN